MPSSMVRSFPNTLDGAGPIDVRIQRLRLSAAWRGPSAAVSASEVPARHTRNLPADIALLLGQYDFMAAEPRRPCGDHHRHTSTAARPSSQATRSWAVTRPQLPLVGGDAPAALPPTHWTNGAGPLR
jgi:hypothetical protein